MQVVHRGECRRWALNTQENEADPKDGEGCPLCQLRTDLRPCC